MSAYIWPSDCGQCVPVETEETAGCMGRVNIHIAHEPGCPNRRNTTEAN